MLAHSQGVHYGMFPGDALAGQPNTVWNIIRPHNWRPATDAEYLVQLDAGHRCASELRCVIAN